MNLLERIDLVIAERGTTRAELARTVGISPGALTNLGTRKGSTMRPETVAAIAQALRVDLHWLCTGLGTPDASRLSPVLVDIIEMARDMPEEELLRLFHAVYSATRKPRG